MKKFMWILLLIIIFPLNAYGEFLEPTAVHMDKAVVLEVENDEVREISEGFVSQTQYVKLKALAGKYKDRIFEIENELSDNVAYNIEVKPGDKVIVGIEEFEDESTYIYISDFVLYSLWPMKHPWKKLLI